MAKDIMKKAADYGKQFDHFDGYVTGSKEVADYLNLNDLRYSDDIYDDQFYEFWGQMVANRQRYVKIEDVKYVTGKTDEEISRFEWLEDMDYVLYYWYGKWYEEYDSDGYNFYVKILQDLMEE